MVGVIGQGLGAKRVDALTVSDCDRFLESASVGQYGALIGRSSLTRIRSTLIGVLRNDLRRGLIAPNVADLSVMPEGSNRGRDRRALSVEELRRLLSKATGTSAILIDFSGRSGLRPAEARAGAAAGPGQRQRSRQGRRISPTPRCISFSCDSA